MKSTLLSFLFTLVLTIALAQDKHRISVQSGFFNNSITQFAELDGGPSYEHQNSFSLGVGYKLIYNLKLSINANAQWQKSTLLSRNSSPVTPGANEEIELQTINLPILLNYAFNRYFYTDLGPVIHFEIHNKPQMYLDSQSGIGFALGFGMQFEFAFLTIFAKPQVQILSVIPFKSSNYQDRLLSAGFLFGMSYPL